MNRMATDGQSNHPLLCAKFTVNQGQIFFFNGAVLKLPGQNFMGSCIFCNHHGPRGVFIESVNNSRPNLAADTFQIRTMIEQCVDQCTPAVPGRGMHDQARLFVKYHNMAVLIQDLQGDGFGLIFDLHGVGDSAQDLVAAFYPVTGFFGLIVDKNFEVCN